MGARLKCRECEDEAEVFGDELPSGWYYTKTEEEMAVRRGKPACPRCCYHFNLVERLKLYSD